MLRSKQVVFNVVVVVAMLLAAVMPLSASPIAETGAAAPTSGTGPDRNRSDEVREVGEVTPEQAIDKIDPALRDAVQKGSRDLVGVYATVLAGTDVSRYFVNMIRRPVIFGGTQSVYGQVAANDLVSLAQETGVVAIFSTTGERDKPIDKEAQNAPTTMQRLQRLQTLRSQAVPYDQTQVAGAEAKGWFDVQDGHKSAAAWAKGFTGDGVIVGVLDDGIDFGHPDLQGTYAWVTDPASPYYGWPMAFSQVSMYYFASDVILGSTALASGFNGSRWVDAKTTVPGSQIAGQPQKSKISYKPLGSAVAHDYIVPRTSKSNLYRVGSFPEKNLLDLYGERPAVIAVDTLVAGVYDTVYVDLDGNYDFTDEKPITKNSPEVYRDMDGDGYADISGGLLVWVSDGANPPPTAEWLWGVTCADSSASMKGCPDNGTLLVFSGAFDEGYTHGTQCASNIAAQGVVNGGASAQPFRINGMVQGGAPQVGLMDFGNHYFNGTDEDEFLVAAFGYDGVANSGDEVQITSNSYGSFGQMWGGWGYIGRLVTALNMSVAPSTVWVFSAGNEGPGYGPQEGEAGPTIIKAGSSTQYGSTGWDSIAKASQIMYGDPSSFFSHGPNRDGSAGVDVLGNGGRGAGDEGINYYGFNGAESWATWGGTSRSAPVVAGNLALIYQAYKERHGVWPTWDQVLTLAKSGATNSVSSPFFQGAGVVNADRSTDLAAGIYGVYATPDEWQVGDWNGVEYLNFAKVAKPGSMYTKTYEVTNPSGYNINVSLSDGYMQLITKTQTTFTTKDESLESAFNFHSPDYLLKLDPASIPADAEVMIVRYVHPYSSFDPDLNLTADSSWRMLLYNWTDINGDGQLWVDRNANGVVNHSNSAVVDNDGFFQLDFANSDIQQGEYVRVDYEFGGIGIPVIVHNPKQRMGNAYYFGFQHRANLHTVKTTTFQIGVEFYKRADFPWLSVSTNALAVPANSAATFDAVATIPANAKPGAYEGIIFMKDPGDANHAAHESALPVVVNVISELPDGGSITFGGEAAMADSMYQNSFTHGYFNWYGGGWQGAGDWRHYFFNVDSADLANRNLLIHTSWVYTPTDFNTWVLGPTNDCASNGVGCAYPQPGLGQPDPSIFGPYTLQPIGSSEPFRSGATYPFKTTTGGPNDWLKVPLARTGLHELALHNVVYAGKSLAEPFKAEVGTLDFDAVIDPAVGAATLGSVNVSAYTSTGAVDLNFTPSIGIPDLNATLSGATNTARTNVTSVVTDTGQCDGAWCAGNNYERIMVSTPGTTQLYIFTDVAAADDVDIFLVYDTNNNNIPEQGVDAAVAQSAGGTGVKEKITVNNPQLGRYFLALNGWDLGTPPTVNLNWYYDITTPSPVPAEPLTVFSSTVAISQTPFVTSTNTYTYVVTADDRAAALYASLSGFTSTANLDLYVSNSVGQIVASSTTTNTTSEMVTVKPATGYRFAAGTKYTVWVHGKTVPVQPTNAALHIWWDHLNLWLTATDPDVHVSAIDPGETVSVTLHFDKSNWNVGDPAMSIRLLAGFTGLANAFDELVTLTRADAPVPSLAASATKTAVSVHGPGQNVFGAPYNIPGHQILIGPSEPVTYTVRFTNTGDIAGNFYVEDYWGQNNFTFTQFINITPTNYGFYNQSGFRIMYITTTLQPGEAYEFTYQNVVTHGIPLGTGYLNFVDVYEDETFVPLFDGFSQGGWLIGHYRNFSTSATTGFPALSKKLASKSAALPGETFTYTISMLSPASVAQAINVTDTLPLSVTFVSATGGATYNPGSHTVAWSGSVPGTSLTPTTFDIVVTLASNAPAGLSVVNNANFYNGVSNALITTKSASTTVLPGADLQLSKTSNKLLGGLGETIQYTLVFRNNGPQAASGATLMDQVPAEVTVATASITATKASTVPFWNSVNRTVNWKNALAVGEVVTVTYNATINSGSSLGLAIINLAGISAPSADGTTYSGALTEVIYQNKLFLPVVRK
ncbi:MAG: S8 family serine peptidase [Chloroflexi bacterium]|nr:S8 family serine peptidase [Chloroflexota bacterium]